MPDRETILDELKATGGACDVVRRKDLAKLSNLAGRDVL